MDSQKIISNNRTLDNYEGIELPKTKEGVMESLKNNVEFNFYKSLDIDNIKDEMLALHPAVHAFWTRQYVKNTLRKVIDSWCHDPTCQFYTKQPMKVNDVNLQYYYRMMAEQKDKNTAEGGFVECLFEL